MRGGLAARLWGPWSWLGLAVAAAVFVVDQAHKWFMLHGLGFIDGGYIQVTPFFDLVMVWNQGVSYGLFRQDGAAGQLALAGLNVAVACLLWLWLVRIDTRLGAVSLALVVGGALGNAVDRVVYGAVADFFHLHAAGWSWYVFNIADVGIVAGVVGLLYDSLRSSHKSAPKAD